jgi:hypothetical protein
MERHQQLYRRARFVVASLGFDPAMVWLNFGVDFVGKE